MVRSFHYYLSTNAFHFLADYIIHAEILEFDAAEEPPSVLDVEVFDFDGPFDHAATLGHSEINFLKHTSTELADIWVPLEGKLAQSSQSKLHLRIFLDNNNGVETIKDYLTKMEKEVGKKVIFRSCSRSSIVGSPSVFAYSPLTFLLLPAIGAFFGYLFNLGSVSLLKC